MPKTDHPSTPQDSLRSPSSPPTEVRSLYWDGRARRNKGAWILNIKRGDFSVATELPAQILQIDREGAEAHAADIEFTFRMAQR